MSEKTELTPDTPGSLHPAGSAACGTVAMLRLPIPVTHLSTIADGLSEIYGSGLTMQENPDGWLDIRSPKPPNAELSDGGPRERSDAR
jgi:hypothetical protein